MKNFYKNRNEHGSNLIGMAIFMLVIGFFTVTAIFLYHNYDMIKSDQRTVNHTQTVQDAVLAFMEREGRYPCPAPLDAAPDSPEFGREASTPCAGGALGTGTFGALGRNNQPVRIGAVPTRSLNISDDHMIDGYKKRYIFAVTENLTIPGMNVKTEQGAITLNTELGHSVSEAPGMIVFALLSLGDTDAGAYDILGNLLAPCPAAGPASDNCRFLTTTNGPATFVTSTEKSYGMGDQSFTHSFAFHSHAVPYKWTTSPWTDCAGVCWEGTQTRTVSCVNYAGAVVVDGLCGHTPRPTAGPQQCGLPPCRWNVGPYRNCVEGTGVRNPVCL